MINIQADTFKGATATAAGNTALWTPSSGQKFRLLRYMIEVTGNCATSGGGIVDIKLYDGNSLATPFAFSLYIPASASTTNPSAIGVAMIELGKGYLSTTANNILNINLSAALTSGKVRVLAIGTEE